MWWKNGVIYQIYPRSFKDSNDDGIGDLKGIIQSLNYLNDGTPDSLGIDAIWINPFFVSPMKDFGYDISVFMDVDPMFGTLEDFKILLEEAHKRKIRIIIDLVLNHTSDEHWWFKESRKGSSNAKADWYIWHKGKNGWPPNNWFSQFELKSAWWYDEVRKEFYLAAFTRHQPELNWRNPQVKKKMFDLVRYWLDMGVDGFRLDVINCYVKDDKFRSNPFAFQLPDFQDHKYDRNRPESIEVCRELRKLTDSYPEKMMVGEIFVDNSKLAASYYGKNNDALHMAFNFDFLLKPWKAEEFYESIIAWYKNLPPGAWPNFTFSNHDNLRHYYRYRKGKWTEARAKLAAALLLTLKGTPFIYYGEELGMTGGKLRRKDLRDPVSIRTWPFKIFCRDLSRTPMQWDGSVNSGFTRGRPWLPLDKNYIKNNVELQKQKPESLLFFYRRLIWLRKFHPALQEGSIVFLEKYLPKAIVYIREKDDEKILIILNFSKDKLVLKDVLKEFSKISSGPLQILISSTRVAAEEVSIDEGMVAEAHEAMVIAQR